MDYVKDYVIDVEDIKNAGIARTDEDLSALFNKRNPILFTHSEDFDGIFSAAVVRKAFGNKVKIVPINYGDEAYKTVLEDYEFRGRDVIITDFSFDPDVIDKIAEQAHVLVWLDHHESAIKKMKFSKAYQEKKIKGLQSVKYSGAYLTWCFFYNNGRLPTLEEKECVPDIIDWVSKYDTWTFKKSEQAFMNNIQFGMKAKNITFGNWGLADILLFMLDGKSGDDYVDSNLVLEYQRVLDGIVNAGQAISDYMENWDYKTHVREAYDVKVKVGGRTLTGCCLNSPGYSQMFKYCYDPAKHDFCVKYHRIGNGQWTGSIYVMDDKKGKVNAADIAIEIAGPKRAGGHPGAAGFHVSSIPSFLK